MYSHCDDATVTILISRCIPHVITKRINLYLLRDYFKLRHYAEDNRSLWCRYPRFSPVNHQSLLSPAGALKRTMPLIGRAPRGMRITLHVRYGLGDLLFKFSIYTVYKIVCCERRQENFNSNNNNYI